MSLRGVATHAGEGRSSLPSREESLSAGVKCAGCGRDADAQKIRRPDDYQVSDKESNRMLRRLREINIKSLHIYKLRFDLALILLAIVRNGELAPPVVRRSFTSFLQLRAELKEKYLPNTDKSKVEPEALRYGDGPSSTCEYNSRVVL